MTRETEIILETLDELRTKLAGLKELEELESRDKTFKEMVIEELKKYRYHIPLTINELHSLTINILIALSRRPNSNEYIERVLSMNATNTSILGLLEEIEDIIKEYAYRNNSDRSTYSSRYKNNY